MKDKYAILLVRVSTFIQDYEPQIKDLKKYASDKGYTKFKIIETKETGLSDLDKKVGTNQLFKFIKENPQYNVVFATEISRIGRRQSVLHQIKEWFIKNKVQFYAKDTGYSLLDESGKISMGGEMMFSLYGLFAENEIQQKKDRFRRAKKSLMEQGLSISGKTLFGYKRVSTENGRTTLIVHEEHSKVVRTIFNWYINGFEIYDKNVSLKKITLECIKSGFPKYTHSKRNVNKLLKEEGYTGLKITNNKRKNPNYKDEEDNTEEPYIVSNNTIRYPVIIDSETFKIVQNRLKDNNSKADKSSVHTTILSKLIKCDKCEGSFNGNYRIFKGRNVDTYRCSSRSKIKPCENKKSVGMSMLDGAIWCLIKTDLPALSKIISKINPDDELNKLKKFEEELTNRIIEIEKEVKSLNQRYKKIGLIQSLSHHDILDAIEDKLFKLDKEKEQIDNEISKIKLILSVRNTDIRGTYNLIKDNIITIEKSKELLKKYINIFVWKIEILLHNQNYSVIKVYFRYYSQKVRSINSTGEVELEELKRFTYIILDKTHSQDIKSYKTVYSIIIDKNGQVQLSDMQTIGVQKIMKVPLDELNQQPLKKYFKKFEYNKLNF